jgi:hypothetical protein
MGPGRRLGPILVVGFAFLVLAAGACGTPDGSAIAVDPDPPLTAETAAAAVSVQPPSGDRRVTGRGDITRVPPIEIDAGAGALWVVATATDEGLIVVATLEDGSTVEFAVTESGGSDPVPLGGAVTGPPVVSFGLDETTLIAPDPDAPAPPLVIDGVVWWTASDGSLHRGDEALGLVGLPDGRFVVAADGSIAVLTDPTTRYPHGVLGDDIEAGSITILEPDGSVRSVIDVEGVVEGISPLWADLDGHGDDELVVTVSDAVDGARIVVFDTDGVIVASGEPIGTGNRWRHQIGTVRDPFGARAIVVVKTPHIGGIAEYWRLRQDRLELITSRAGITSHRLGSRNLDLAVIVDADGDDVEELVAPTGDLQELVGLFLTEDGVGESWRVSLPAPLASNLHAITDDDGAWLVAGLADGRLLVWPPVRSSR